MIDIEARIREAATDPELRAAASTLWQTASQTLFFPHDERDGLRISDCGHCVGEVWHDIHVGPKVFESDVQLYNLDTGTMQGCWHACLLAASLKADGGLARLEKPTARNGVPGHIDLYYDAGFDGSGVVEFKNTHWGRGLTPPHERAEYQVLQLMSYCEAEEVGEGAIVTIGPATPKRYGSKIRVDWYDITHWSERVEAEWQRLSAALADEPPPCDAKESWRKAGCPRCNPEPATL